MGRRYYFVDTKLAADFNDEGLEFETFEDACEEAERALREKTLNTKAKTIWMSVFDEDRKLVHRARLEVIQETGDNC